MAKFSYIVPELTNAFGTFENFKTVLRRIKELGYSGVELNFAPPMGFEMSALREFVESINLPVVSFLTGANYFSEGLCLVSPRDDIRQRAVERLKEYTEVAAQFGAILVVGQMQGFSKDEPDRATAEARIEESLKQIVESAERFGTTIVIEPVNHLQVGFNNTVAQVMALAGRIGSPRLKPMLDSFHMNIEEKSVIEPIQRVGSELAHFHLCETNGDVLGSGHLDIKAILDALENVGYKGYISLKIYRQPWSAGAESSLGYLASLK